MQGGEKAADGCRAAMLGAGGPLALWWAKFGWPLAATVSLRGALPEAIDFWVATVFH